MTASAVQSRVLKTEEYFIEDEPYYEPVSDEVEVFEAAYRNQLPILLKGPTGCGKTRFMEYMAWRLKRPLLSVSCHHMTIPTPPQSRAARALLNITRDELSRRSGVSKRAIASYEAEASKLMRANLLVIRQTFEMMGIEFIGADIDRIERSSRIPFEIME